MAITYVWNAIISLVQVVGGALPECWGYEEGCGRDERLFVPRCDEPAAPWLVHLLYFTQDSERFEVKWYLSG